MLPEKGQNSIDFSGLEDPKFTYLGDKCIGKWLHTLGRRISDNYIETVGNHGDVNKADAHFETVGHYRQKR